MKLIIKANIQKLVRLSIVWMIVLMSHTISYAKTVVLDDTGTFLAHPNLQFAWESVTPPPSQSQDNMVAQTDAIIRLNVSQWQNKPVKIYLTCQMNSHSNDRIYFRGLNSFYSVLLKPYERTLVYQGTLTEAYLVEPAILKINKQAQAFTRPEQLQLIFELEE